MTGLKNSWKQKFLDFEKKLTTTVGGVKISENENLKLLELDDIFKKICGRIKIFFV